VPIVQPVPLPEGTSFEGGASSGVTVRVVDRAGPLPGAQVTIGRTSGGAAFASLTNAAGTAEFPVLPPGSGYTVDVSVPGYATVRYGDLTVESRLGEGSRFMVRCPLRATHPPQERA